MEVDSVPVQNDVTPETFVAFMNKRKSTTPTPATFRNIKFSPYAEYNPREYRGPLHFKNDTFIDMELYCFNISKDMNVKFNDCMIGTGEHKLSWLKVDLGKTNWQGSTIDGSYKGSRSEIKSCYFSDADMSQCTLKNFRIYDSDTRLIAGAKFTDSTMINMAFEGFRGLDDISYYKFEDTSFRNMQATNLTWDAVQCAKNVDLINAKITKFSPLGGTEFTDARFGIYQKRMITINPAMFNDVRKIDPYLDNINNVALGALFLHTLDSIPDKTVKHDFAEQLIQMIKHEPVLSVIYANSITLRQSIITHLAHSDYDTSPKIQNFITTELLKEGNDILIPESLRPSMYRALCALEDSELLGRQFIVNQLIAEYPSLKERFYQVTPIKEFVKYLENEKTTTGGNSVYHIFYNPDDMKTALYLPVTEYKKLVEANQVPQQFSFLQYRAGEENRVIEESATVERQSRVLSEFPALHSLWSRADGLFTPVVHSLFERSNTLDAGQAARAQQIKNQMISMFKHKSYRTRRLDLKNDANLLSEMFAPFYIDGPNADNARWQLVELMQRELSPKIKQFPGHEQKTIAIVYLIRTLSDIFYTRYCTVTDKSPYAPRQLTLKLIEDLKAFAPEAISEDEAALWTSLLMPKSENELSSSVALARRMDSYQISGRYGEEMNKIMQLYYPLS
ncbi:hypothetical protein CUN67_21615 (plasmid) [Pantoea cypripedii]|uniref:E3 ubiquitin-protein ligase SopA-like catalytic domain-containing protein n=2 Tax=Pantoea cypripedii TaxID=55209 RepID=A0A6B9GBM4_PANCY|nr:hypothetical protein CUN67_21615 [Pantoea cypripedii]